MPREGLLVIISGPSGTGKGTLLELLRQKNDNIRYSISVTTRKPRLGEEDGKNYFFRTVEEFKDMMINDELLEWDEYCDNFYGTPRKYIENTIETGNDVILEITAEGAINVKSRFQNCVTVFIMPPSFEELHKRICGRGTEAEEVINKRLSKAKNEIQFIGKYDYVVVNDDLNIAVENINNILIAEKLKVSRNTKFIKNFM